MSHKPTIGHRHQVAQSRLFTIESLDLTFSNGQKRNYERLVPNGSGAVMIVPVTDDGHILLIKEYAAGIEGYNLTLPKGTIDLGESPEEAASRELKEEIKFGAKHLHFLKNANTSPGYMKHGVNIFVGQDLYPHSLEGDEPEPLEVVRWPLNDIENLVLNEDVLEATAIAALYLAQSWLHKQA